MSLCRQSSATNVGNDSAQEAVELLGVKTPREVVVEIRNAGQLVPSARPIVQPHYLGPGGGVDLTNPGFLPPGCILRVRRVQP